MRGIDMDEILLRWLPLLLVFVVLALFFRSKRLGYEKWMADQLEEARRLNQMVERVAIALERSGKS
jgi:hypothetical protein